MTYLRSLCTFAAVIALLLLNALFLPAHAQDLLINYVNVTPVSCNGGANGTATVVASGGTRPYTYLWTSPLGDTSDTATGLPAGPFTVTVTDSKGDQAVRPFVITQPVKLNGTAATTSASANGVADGTATVTASGGTQTYTYLWSTGETGPTVYGLAAGAYSVTITDGNACSRTLNGIVVGQSAAAAPSITWHPSASTINAGGNTAFSVNAANATGYQWQVNQGSGYINIGNGGVYSGATTSTLSITGATAGMNGYIYRVVVTGATAPAAVSNGAALTVNAALPTVTSVSPASGPTTGGTYVTISGSNFSGVTAVKFGATSATNITVVNTTQITASSPAGMAGTVDVTVTSSGGTSATSAADQFTYSAAQQTQTITFANPGPQIFGTTPTLTATSSSGLTPTFTSSTTGVCTITSSGALTFVTAGSCTIDADQAGNATYAQAPYVPQTFTVNAVVPSAPVVGVATAGDAQATVTFTAPASSGGAAIIAGGYTVTASPGGGSATGSSSPITVTGLTNGRSYTFKVTATNSVGIGIASAVSNSVTPTASPLPLEITVPPLLTAAAGSAYSYTFTATGGTAPYTFASSGSLPPGLTLSSAGVLSGTPTAAGSFTISVQVKDALLVTSPVSAFNMVVTGGAAPLPSPNKTVSVAAGATALVDVTAGATGGPFTAAGVVSLAPANAGVADIVGGAGAYGVRFVPAASFAGVAVASYTLSNATTTSAPATVTITVGARADVAQDAEVAGLATAQASAAQRFTTAQVTNFTQRLESLHGGGWGRSSFGLSLATDDARKMARSSNGNGVADQVISGNPLRSGMRTVGLKPQREAQAQPAATDLPDLPGAAAEQARSPWAFWVNGAISYGRERNGDADDRYRFTTNGISAGVDYRVNSWITVGTGLGISTDRSRVGNKGTRSDADSTVAVAYASMRPMQGVFVDALLGYGVLSFDSQRYITATGDMATGSRDGKQLFGSIATGLEFYRTDWMWSPYARLEFSQAKLDAYTEDGPAAHALKYFDQTARSHKAVLGARAEGKVAVRWGHIMPQVRVDYARSFDEQNEAGLAYADLAAQGPAYTLRGRAMDTGRWTVGLGGRLLLRSGVELGVEYTTNIDQSSAYVGSLRLGLRVPF